MVQEFTKQDIEYVIKNKNLETLRICCNSEATDDIKYLFENLKNLKDINVAYCTDDIIETISKSCTDLE